MAHHFYMHCSEKVAVELKATVGFDDGKQWTLRIWKKMCSTYKRCYDGRKFLMESNDTENSKEVFLREIHETWQSSRTSVSYLDKTSVNHYHTRNSCWKNDGSSGLRVPVGKWKGHAGSVATGFLSEGEYFGLNRSPREITTLKWLQRYKVVRRTGSPVHFSSGCYRHGQGQYPFSFAG